MPLGAKARFLFLLLSAIACVAAALIQSSKALPFEATYQVSQRFSSPAIPDDIPLAVVQSAVAASRFESLIGGPVQLHAVPTSIGENVLSAVHVSPEVAKIRVEQAMKLLAAELDRIAMAEVDASQQHLEELEKEVSARLKKRQEDKSGVNLNRVASLTNKDAKRALRLQREVQGLESFVAGGARPAWIGPLLDRSSLVRQEKKLQVEKNELKRLQELWTPGSRAVQAQIKLVQREKAELLAIERHLAAVLLDSHRLELRLLEDESYSRVRQNSESRTTEVRDDDKQESPLTESAAWIAEKSQALKAKAERLEKRATLIPVGEVLTEPMKPWGHWLCGGLWILSAVLLLFGLSVTDSDPSRKRRVASGKSAPPSPSWNSPPPAESVAEDFLGDLALRMKQELGRPVRRLLILSAHGGERSSLSLRLAKNFSLAKTNVKLLDLDLQGRHLSQRVSSDSRSPGISDLLSHGGPVEEFFASIPGTRIQFAPAGTRETIGNPPASGIIEQLLRLADNELALIDASYSSPLALMTSQVDAVLILRQPKERLGSMEESVLQSLRASKLPLWGISQGNSGVFPYF